MKRKIFPLMMLYVVALVLVSVVVPASAHHSFAMFDAEKMVVVNGTVSKVSWRNPHVYFYIRGTESESSSDVKEYIIEGGSINILSRYGWKANTLKVGENVTVSFRPLRDGEPGGLLDSVTLPNGTVMKQE